MRRALSLALVLLAPLAARAAHVAQAEAAPEEDLAAYIRSHYTKFEYRVPMRDGVELFTAVYIPNDRAKQYPILLHRTPYSVAPYGADRYPGELGPSAAYAKEGFIFAYQDVRGRLMSGGTFVNMRPMASRGSQEREGKGGAEAPAVDESTDAWDTVDWLVKHVPANNGRVGMWGVSYPGFYAAAGAVHSHPALKAVSPQAPIADWFWDDMHRHGAFVLPLSFDFFAVFGPPRPEPTWEWPERFDHGTFDGYDFFLDLGPLSNVQSRYFHEEIPFWNELVRHPNYDAFWQSRNLLPHLEGVEAAVLVVGGWFDTEDLYGPLNIYRSIEEKNPKATNVLVMGPWQHGGWLWTEGDRLGTAQFGWPTARYYQKEVELPFFRHFLKGEGAWDAPEALMFETGANRWRRFEAWPPPGVKQRTLYFGAGGRLVDEVPGEAGADAFLSDPAKPVPYTQEVTTAWAKAYMTEDQRFAARRPDVLVYETEPLEDDLTLAGPLTADLYVSTTGRDADWIVKVVDVFPPQPPDDASVWATPAPPTEHDRVTWGGQRLVRVEAFRGRFRNSYEHPEPFAPGEVERVRFRLNDVLHTFQRGHRVMVQVQSTFFPFIDRNPQSWVDNIFEARDEDFVKATHTVHRGPGQPSGLEFGVLPTASWTVDAREGRANR